MLGPSSAPSSSPAPDASGSSSAPDVRDSIAQSVDSAQSIDNAQSIDTSASASGGSAAGAPRIRAVEVVRPRKTSRYADMARTPLRNMVWAMGLTMAVVAVVGIAFFGVGGDGARDTLENSELDLAESAARARDAVDFPVAEPELGDDWSLRTARLEAQAPASWEIAYSSPDRELVTLVEQEEIGAPVLSAALPGVVVEEETVIDGAACQVLSTAGSGDAEAARGLTCAGDGWGILVHGTADDAELRELMEAAISSLR
ncbi:DUF4245 family protein [Brachybacterium sp. DNPG3]